jgi:hypothetical protein
MTPATAARTAAARGIWGGQGVVLRVETDRSTLDFDCGHGSIEEPLVTDVDGRFDLAAAIVQERPGPVLIDDPGRGSQAARASGRITGTTMTLSVKGVGTDVMFGPFSLTEGEAGRVVKCR